MEKRKKERNNIHVAITWMVLIILGILLGPPDYMKTILMLLFCINTIFLIEAIIKKSRKLQRKNINKVFLIVFGITMISIILSGLSLIWLAMQSKDSQMIYYHTKSGRIRPMEIQPEYKIYTMLSLNIFMGIMLIIYSYLSIKRYKNDALLIQESLKELVI